MSRKSLVCLPCKLKMALKHREPGSTDENLVAKETLVSFEDKTLKGEGRGMNEGNECSLFLLVSHLLLEQAW